MPQPAQRAGPSRPRRLSPTIPVPQQTPVTSKPPPRFELLATPRRHKQRPPAMKHSTLATCRLVAGDHRLGPSGHGRSATPSASSPWPKRSPASAADVTYRHWLRERLWDEDDAARYGLHLDDNWQEVAAASPASAARRPDPRLQLGARKQRRDPGPDPRRRLSRRPSSPIPTTADIDDSAAALSVAALKDIRRRTSRASASRWSPIRWAASSPARASKIRHSTPAT